MKALFLHPPLYPVNHKFFNELGKLMELTVLSFGNAPGLHQGWKVSDYLKEKNNYKLIILDGETNLKRFAVSYRTQLNPKFLRHVKEEKPDIVISVAFWFPSMYMALLKKRYNCKLAILTDAIASTEKNNSKFRNYIRKFIAKRTDTFIAGSDLTVNYLNQLFPNKAVAKSMQTIDVVTWRNDIENLPNKTKLKSELGFSKDRITLLSIGHFIPLKNHLKLFDQLKEVEECELILVGDGVLKEEYLQVIENKGLANRVKLIPYQTPEEIKKYYKAADIFVFPTNRDTFGYVVPEALASGVPVVCSINAGASSMIQNDFNGMLFKPNENFALQINKTIQSLEKMTKNAITSVAQFTLSEKAKTFHKILTKLN